MSDIENNVNVLLSRTSSVNVSDRGVVVDVHHHCVINDADADTPKHNIGGDFIYDFDLDDYKVALESNYGDILSNECGNSSDEDDHSATFSIGAHNDVYEFFPKI